MRRAMTYSTLSLVAVLAVVASPTGVSSHPTASGAPLDGSSLATEAGVPLNLEETTCRQLLGSKACAPEGRPACGTTHPGASASCTTGGRDTAPPDVRPQLLSHPAAAQPVRPCMPWPRSAAPSHMACAAMVTALITLQLAAILLLAHKCRRLEAAASGSNRLQQHKLPAEPKHDTLQPKDSCTILVDTPTDTTSTSGASKAGASLAPLELQPSDRTSNLLSMAGLPAPLQQWAIDPAHFCYLRYPDGSLRELGAGACGRVLKAEYHSELVAAKQIPLDQDAASRRTFVREALRLSELRHGNIVNFIGVSIEDEGRTGVIVMELCEGRDLYHLLPAEIDPATRKLSRRTGRSLDSATACAATAASSSSWDRPFGWHRRGRDIALGVARALNYLHAKKVVHLDIKSCNVLLTQHGVAKLADVGFARVQTRSHLSYVGEAAAGTFAWCAPEVLLGSQVSEKADIYSFGVLLWEIVTGERPQRGQLRAPCVPHECSEEVAQLILRCMAFDAAERPSAQQCMRELTVLARSGGPYSPRGTQ